MAPMINFMTVHHALHHPRRFVDWGEAIHRVGLIRDTRPIVINREVLWERVGVHQAVDTAAVLQPVVVSDNRLI